METNGNGRIITTRDASITTATVSIRTLTIDAKQMTLAVFRQLRQQPLLDPHTAALGGQPWGLVNYCPGDCRGNGEELAPHGDCKKEEEHLHVVWQADAELRRDCVRPLADCAYFADALRAKSACHAVAAWAWHQDLFSVYVYDNQSFCLAEKATGEEIDVPILSGLKAPYLVNQTSAGLRLRRSPTTTSPRDSWKNACSLRDAANRCDKEWDALSNVWRKQYSLLEDLPQLFIAV